MHPPLRRYWLLPSTHQAGVFDRSSLQTLYSRFKSIFSLSFLRLWSILKSSILLKGTLCQDLLSDFEDCLHPFCPFDPTCMSAALCFLKAVLLYSQCTLCSVVQPSCVLIQEMAINWGTVSSDSFHRLQLQGKSYITSRYLLDSPYNV